jgi:hypothetical protein
MHRYIPQLYGFHSCSCLLESVAPLSMSSPRLARFRIMARMSFMKTCRAVLGDINFALLKFYTNFRSTIPCVQLRSCWLLDTFAGDGSSSRVATCPHLQVSESMVMYICRAVYTTYVYNWPYASVILVSKFE